MSGKRKGQLDTAELNAKLPCRYQFLKLIHPPPLIRSQFYEEMAKGYEVTSRDSKQISVNHVIQRPGSFI